MKWLNSRQNFHTWVSWQKENKEKRNNNFTTQENLVELVIITINNDRTFRAEGFSRWISLKDIYYYLLKANRFPAVICGGEFLANTQEFRTHRQDSKKIENSIQFYASHIVNL